MYLTVSLPTTDGVRLLQSLDQAQSPGARQFWVLKVGQGLMYFKVHFL